LTTNINEDENNIEESDEKLFISDSIYNIYQIQELEEEDIIEK
jgi:hypothetical protein